ncbi:SGNH/GDSL hydrolase family protein [Bacillus sp. FJAT-52991]|uniref:SGNH/GDSL hydrolase family protein n=1 Tax=Bacillus kandeliae TaxID=3129297 RepID=A0ABZ2N2V6_9BACI
MRKLKKAWLLVVAFVCSLSACSGQEKEVEVVPKDLRVVSVGDSLTEGIGDSTKTGGYIPYLQDNLVQLEEVKSATFTNYGVKGNRTDQLLERLDEQKVKESIKKADFVIITIGGNDIMKVFKENFGELKVKQFEQERKDYEKRLNDIIVKVRQSNQEAGIVLVGLYNPFMEMLDDVEEVEEILQDWNETSKQTIEKYDRTTFVPVEDLFTNSKEDLFYDDQFHPNDRGYELIGERIFDTIKGEELEELTNQKIMYVKEEKR